MLEAKFRRLLAFVLALPLAASAQSDVTLTQPDANTYVAANGIPHRHHRRRDNSAIFWDYLALEMPGTKEASLN